MTERSLSPRKGWAVKWAKLPAFVFCLLVTLSISVSLLGAAHVSAATVRTFVGSVGGATYLIEVPANWNGTLLLYSHGYVPPGSPNPARNVGDPATGAFLLAQGFALAGSSYSGTGWAVEQAFSNQIEVLDTFQELVGTPYRTIAWGHSLGGIITAGLIQKFPERFAAALPMCGVLSGGVGVWNAALDSAFAFKTLVAPDAPLQLVQITNPAANLQTAQGILTGARQTAEGRARLALVAALSDIPGWFTPGSPEPRPDDFATREFNQFLWAQSVDFPFQFAFRAELEARAGGNPSWNTGLDYARQLARSINRDEVVAMYALAGLDLDDDLRALAAAPRITADAKAVNYLARNIIFNGDIDVPVMTLHTLGDGLVTVENEQAYARVVRAAGNQHLLRQSFVHRAGHCTFTPAETVTALFSLIQRVDSGAWGELDPWVLNAQASALGALNVVPPEFVEFEPFPFLRPFDSRSQENEAARVNTDRLRRGTAMVLGKEASGPGRFLPLGWHVGRIARCGEGDRLCPRQIRP